MARVISLPAFNATKFDEFAKSRIFDGFVNSSQGLRAAKASCGERIAYRLKSLRRTSLFHPDE
jgi:hypothetical protein